MDLDPPAAYGRLDDDDDVLMAQEDQSVSEESVYQQYYYYPCLNPPAYGHPDDGERPPFVLLEPEAYLADRDNATTASCGMRGLGGTLKVTFCIAHPPLVSYMCVHATAFAHYNFAAKPDIIAAETNGGLVLFRLVIGTCRADTMFPSNQQYFMYDASGPSLEHLPNPSYRIFKDHSVAIVRKCGSSQEEDDHDCSSICDYVIAAQSSGFGSARTRALVLYHSDTKTWSKVPVVAMSFPTHIPFKTLTIGGDRGTVAWVDLWRDILLCDVLDKHPILRTIRLPPPVMPIDLRTYDNPLPVRDIALLGGYIKYVELHYLVQDESLSSSTYYYAWKVAVWSINTAGSFSSEDWHMDYLLNSTEIPESWLPMSTLHIGLPNLSLQDDGIVYFLTKVGNHDCGHVAWVVALDLGSKTVQNLGEFNPMRTIGFEKGYIASRISKYLKGN